MDIAGKRLVTPSKPDYWHGTPVAGATFTAEQTAALRKIGSRAQANQRKYQLPAVYDVRLWTEPTAEEPARKQMTFPCPVVSGTRDRTRLCVIAPNGMEQWVEWKK